MKLNITHLNKLEALAATGMPGAYKVIIFFLIQYVHGLHSLGSIASWQAIAQILGFFTAIGWSSLILVRVSKAETHEARIKNLNHLTVMSGLTLFAFIIGTQLIGVFTGNHEDSTQISYWLAGWTLYQLPRHYFIALKKYRSTLLLDTSIIILSTLSIFAAPTEKLSLLLSLSLIACSLTAFLLIQIGTKPSPIKINYDLKGLEFGFANFLSGGITISLIPLASHFEGDILSGIISIFISISSIALLIPRAISLNQLPTITQSINDPKKLATQTLPMRRHISLSNLCTSIFCLATAAVILLQLSEEADHFQLALIFLAITIQNTLSTQGLVEANILMAKERSRTLLKINLIASATFFSTTMGVSLGSTHNSFTYICLSGMLINLYRLHQTKKIVKTIYDCHKTL